MSRKIGWAIFIGALAITLGLKVAQSGWFAFREVLVLNGKPALVFFTLSKGCECQMSVVHAAEAQLTNWQPPIQLLRVDFERRPDLAEQFDIARAPALVLLDKDGQIIWKQDEGLSDKSPLDLEQARIQVEALNESSYNK